MSAKAAKTSVTTTRTVQILLGLTIAPAKKDSQGMDTHVQVKKILKNNTEVQYLIFLPTEIYRM